MGVRFKIREMTPGVATESAVNLDQVSTCIPNCSDA